MYYSTPVKVMVLRSVPYNPLLGSALQKGSEEKIPRWIAQILEEKGFVEILEKPYSPQELTKIRFSHTQQRVTLNKLDDFFYINTIATINKLGEKAKKETDIELLRIIDRVKEDFNEISNMRLSYIVRAIQFQGLDTISKSLTIEEKLLSMLIQKIMLTWLKKYALIR
ncbi:MAG: hypothetical protein QXT53_03115 [Ignisphaera sp.]